MEVIVLIIVIITLAMGSDAGLKITYTGDECPFDPTKEVTTTFEFVCSKQSPFLITSLTLGKENCTNQFVIETTEACPKKMDNSDSNSNSNSDSISDNSDSKSKNQNWPEDDEDSRIFPYRRFEQRKEFLKGLLYFISLILTFLLCSSCFYSCCVKKSEEDLLPTRHIQNNNSNTPPTTFTRDSSTNTDQPFPIYHYTTLPLPSAPIPQQQQQLLYNPSVTTDNATAVPNLLLYPMIQYPSTFQPPREYSNNNYLHQ